MKKHLCLCLTIGLLLTVASCENPPVEPEESSRPLGDTATAVTTASQSTTTSTVFTTTTAGVNGKTGFMMLRHPWDGYGVSRKGIYASDLGYAIMENLSHLQETGEVIPKISDKTLEEAEWDMPVDHGTVWLDCGDKGLFRLNSAMTEICRVTSHFGEGRVLQMTDTLEDMLNQAWFYYPFNCWSGDYKDGTVTLQHMYTADSAVEWVGIENVYVENSFHADNNKLTLRVRSGQTKTVKVYMKSFQSEDNFGSGEHKTMELIKGRETTVDFIFYGFRNVWYYVTITLDNTQITLKIDPR